MKKPLGAAAIYPFWGRRPQQGLLRLPRMPSKKKVLVTFLASFALLGSAGAAQARPLSSPESSLLQAINTVRASNGLAPLRIDVHLLRAARAHSADMMRRQYFAHGSVARRALSRGARGPVFGEDLAWSTGITSDWVVNAWLNSPTHRAVLLRPGFRRIGIGYSFGTFIGHGGAGVVTADFAGR
jgi:uncharacterized protein YkwD